MMKKNQCLYLAIVLSVILFSCSHKSESASKPQTESQQSVTVVNIKDENACWEYFKGKQFRHGDWGLAFDDKNNVSFYDLKSDPYYVHGKFLYKGYLEVGGMYYTYSRNLVLHPEQGRDWNFRLNEEGKFTDQSNFDDYTITKF